MTRFQQQMDRLFDRWGWDLPRWPALAVSYPALNVWEDNNFVYAEAELPGLKLDDLEISVTGPDQLTVKGTRPQPKVPEQAVWHRQERGFGSFTRVITLPASVDPAKVEARLEQGVLIIKLAKSEAAKPKKIPVKAE
jgi:HSP20 family protein